MSNDIKISRNKQGPVYIIRQHNDGLSHNGFKKGDRVSIKNDDTLDEVYKSFKGEEGEVICTFPSICPGKISIFVSLDRDKGKWPEADEGENFGEDAVEKITEE